MRDNSTTPLIGPVPGAYRVWETAFSHGTTQPPRFRGEQRSCERAGDTEAIVALVKGRADILYQVTESELCQGVLSEARLSPAERRLGTLHLELHVSPELGTAGANPAAQHTGRKLSSAVGQNRTRERPPVTAELVGTSAAPVSGVSAPRSRVRGLPLAQIPAQEPGKPKVALPRNREIRTQQLLNSRARGAEPAKVGSCGRGVRS